MAHASERFEPSRAVKLCGTAELGLDAYAVARIEIDNRAPRVATQGRRA
jgi:hypothetical protein